ncbi:acyl-CoA N-acyltransferase [Aspergillus pseudonomiae]|uniref:Acyl-CoA N-acyltransferase n=1 Tax=Aspergillus pseudonomiae TaxID=1506151 RepID=A0A5N6HLU0_9EURO|nr:acyl-CoA N-acyltransferase [Aspergillus pseudonomiae]KAB8254804.1 acyl-CoA N-acyltransferase [Aspergillus pseudonomiae]KAE8402011.1 acyl-CoA N-acyltransferase [Aspergillus pseudonomiae]
MTSNNPPFRIAPAHSTEHFEAAKALFTSYAEWLDLDLTFQGFASELQSLPGKYAAPHGELLLAYSADEGIPIGCVAVRPLKQRSVEMQGDVQSHRGYCEMKRLYVSPEARGTGLGKALVNSIVKRAKDLGYKMMMLDTLPSMIGAIQLYKRVGFVEIAPYYETPLEGTLFLGLDLTQNI